MAIAVLSAAITFAGLLGWEKPALSDTSPWLVADVPGSLWGLILGSTILCLGTAAVLTLRVAGLRAWEPATLGWLLLTLLSAAALVWNAVYSAALSTTDFGALIPIFHWLFTFAPAALAGLLFVRRRREDRRVAALGTGIVTVPLFQLSVVFLASDLGELVMASLVFTGLLAVAPLCGGIALAGALGRRDHLPHPAG